MSKYNNDTETLSDYFNDSNAEFINQKREIKNICAALAEAQKNIGKEKAFFALVLELEKETDPDKADIYRKAIEIALMGDKLNHLQ